jgi:putative glutamine amidotransferase
MGSEPLLVTSLHHQAVKTTGRQVIVSATAPDGVVEGIELPRHRFAIGIQCHPEELLADGDERSLRLFQWFIQAAARASRWAEPVSATAADR